MLKQSNVFDIRAVQLEQASPLLAQALEQIWDQYGLDICLTLMMWYSAKGIIYANLTEAEKDATLAQCKNSLDACYGVIQNQLAETDTGSGEV